MSRTCVDTLTQKQTDFSLKIEMGGEAILGLSRLDCLTAKTGRTVNGGAFAPFILTVDWLGWLCYLSYKWGNILFYFFRMLISCGEEANNPRN